MGSKKQEAPKPPPAPSVPPPPSVTTPLGTGSYDKKKNLFTYETPYDADNADVMAQAGRVFRDSLGQLENPQQAVDYQRTLSRNMMLPEFNHQAELARGNLKAQLGNRYFSTFGQLTADETAMNEARARAGLEVDIENNAQQAYDRLLGRSSALGTLAGAAQEYAYNPYQWLSNMQGVGGQTVNAYGANLANIYGSQAQFAGTAYAAQQQAQAQRQAAMMQLAGQIISPFASAGAGAMF